MSVEVVVNRNADRLIKGEKHLISLDDAYWDSQLKAGNITVLQDHPKVAVEPEDDENTGITHYETPSRKPVKKPKKKGRG